MFAGIHSSGQDVSGQIARIVSKEEEEIELRTKIDYLKAEKVNLWLDELEF